MVHVGNQHTCSVLTISMQCSPQDIQHTTQTIMRENVQDDQAAAGEGLL